MDINSTSGTEKNSNQWFILRDGAYDGPFTFEQIRRKISQRSLGPQSYLWQEGFANWQQLRELKVFELALLCHDGDFFEEGPEAESLFPSFSTDASEKFHSELASIPWTLTTDISSFQVSPPLLSSPEATAFKKTRWRWAAAAGVLLVTGLGAWQLVASRPPAIADVSAEDLPELTQARQMPLEKGLRVSVVKALSSNKDPHFYIATNLPDQTPLQIRIEGLRETLLGELQVSETLTGVVKNNLVMVQAFLERDSIPRGEYRVTVIRPEAENNVLVRKTFFLGGAADKEYRQKLNEWHERVSKQAKTEIFEIKQWSDTLAGQLEETGNAFREISRLGPTQKLKAWGDFHHDWSGLQSQLTAMGQTWSADKSLYYKSIYELLAKLEVSTTQLHAGQDTWIRQTSPRGPQVEASLSEEASAAQSLLQTIRARTATLGRTPSYSTGLPSVDEVSP